jgi:hypothetical protein
MLKRFDKFTARMLLYSQDALAALPEWAVEVPAAGAWCALAGAAAVQRPQLERAAHVATARQQAAAQVCGVS